MSPSEKKLTLIEDVIRLRRAQAQSPGNRDIAAVRMRIEDEIGTGVSQRIAGQALGVSHTALQRWVKRGDIPTVLTSDGRREIALPTLLRLAEAIERQRAAGIRSRHLIEAIVTRDRERAAQIRARRLRNHSRAPRDPHERALQRAREYHVAVAGRLNRQMVEEARQNILRWRRAEKIHPRYAARWEAILNRPLRDIKRLIVADDESARDLRQNTPFAGALSEAERDEIFRDVA